MSSALRSILVAEGVGGLYTGFLPVMWRSVVFDFSMPYFYAIISQGYRDAFVTQPGLLAGLLLRTLAGQCNAIVNSPLETVTNRMMAARTPQTLLQTCSSVLAEGGVSNFWGGLGTSLILAINPALSYTLFDALKSFVTVRFMKPSPDAAQPEHKEPPAHESPTLSPQLLLLLGVIAKALTLVLVYPLIRAKVLQTTTGGTLLGTLRDVAMVEGYAGLYKGMAAKFSKSLGSTALLLTTKDLTEQWLSTIKRSRESQAR